jgi:hypothetical protein
MNQGMAKANKTTRNQAIFPEPLDPCGDGIRSDWT